jgi:hypothetical protein
MSFQVEKPEGVDRWLASQHSRPHEALVFDFSRFGSVSFVKQKSH